MNVFHRQCLAMLVVVSVQTYLATTLPAQAPAQPGKAPVQQEAVVPSAEDKRKALEADADRLVRLAEQLKVELEHTRQDELSVKVVRDADEIERLARSTRTRVH